MTSLMPVQIAVDFAPADGGDIELTRAEVLTAGAGSPVVVCTDDRCGMVLPPENPAAEAAAAAVLAPYRPWPDAEWA